MLPCPQGRRKEIDHIGATNHYHKGIITKEFGVTLGKAASTSPKENVVDGEHGWWNKLQVDAYLLELKGVDLILGMDWKKVWGKWS